MRWSPLTTRNPSPWWMESVPCWSTPPQSLFGMFKLVIKKHKDTKCWWLNNKLIINLLRCLISKKTCFTYFLMKEVEVLIYNLILEVWHKFTISLCLQLMSVSKRHWIQCIARHGTSWDSMSTQLLSWKEWGRAVSLPYHFLDRVLGRLKSLWSICWQYLGHWPRFLLMLL